MMSTKYRIVHLKEFLSEINDLSPREPFPIVHTSDGFSLSEIVGCGELRTSECTKFSGESLLYAFIGRSAYKKPRIESPEYWELPVAFVMKFPIELEPKRVFPFDSGGFIDGRFPSYIGRFNLLSFEFSGEIELIYKYLNIFFGSIDNYINSRSRSREDLLAKYCIDSRFIEIMALISLLNSKDSEMLDDRAKSIEVQFGNNIAFSKEISIGVVLPSEYERDKALIKDLKKYGFKCMFYKIYPLNIDAYYYKIYELCAELIKGRKK